MKFKRLMARAGANAAEAFPGGGPAGTRIEVLLAGQQRILEMIAKGESFESVLCALATFIESQSPGSYCSILAIDEDGNLFRKGAAPSLPPAFQDGVDGQPADPSAGSCGAAAARRAQVISEDIATDPLWVDYRDWMIGELGLRSAWSTPIFSPCGTHVVGVFALYSEKPRRPSDEDRELIGITTHLAEVAFERKRNLEELYDAKCRAEEASYAKSKFLANISHELRTPLNAVIGYSEILIEELEELGHPNLAKDMQNIRMAGQRLLAMIGSILDISKIEADMMKVSPTSFSISSVVDNVIGSSKPYIEEKGNRLVVESRANADTMFSDSDKLIQILQQLVSNANKFSDAGTITLTVSQDKTGDDDHILFQIRDTGQGIHPEEMENLFSPFAQPDHVASKKHGGIGLGLALSYNFAKMMGGDITAESEVGKGSVFTVRLPIIMSANPE